MRYRVRVDGELLEFETQKGEGDTHRVIAGTVPHSLRLDPEQRTLEWDGVKLDYTLERDNGRPARVIVGERSFDVEHIKERGPSSRAGASTRPAGASPAPTRPRLKLEGGQPVTAPMPGTVVSIIAQEGQAVEAGQVLVVLEAMKMENEIKAPGAGTVRQIAVKAGDSVNGGDVLVVLE